MRKYENINKPIRIGSVKIRNRLVFAPMVTNLANSDGTVSSRLKQFIKRRAKSVGLVITENTAVNKAGRLFPNTRIDDDRFIPGLKSLFDVIHAEGAGALIQLDHEGRETTHEATGNLGPIAPSPIPSPTFNVTPREMTLEDIEKTINDFVDSAIRARKAGADGVELQGAHGFLIHQFLSPRTNRRRDKYGGNPQRRARFFVEIIEKIKKKIATDFIVCCRISAESFVDGGLTIKDTKFIAKLLQEAGADIIHVSSGVLEAIDHISPTASFPEAPHADLSAEIKKSVDIPVIAVGKVPGIDLAEKLLGEGKADMVAFARSLLADPDLIEKEASGRHHEVIQCKWCNQCLSKILSPEPEIACVLHKKQKGEEKQ